MSTTFIRKYIAEMFKLILTLLCACALAAASSIKSTEKPYYSLEEADKHFELFIDNFNREYLSEEEKNMRFEIFKTNLDNINKKNMNPHEHATFGKFCFVYSILPTSTRDRVLVRGSEPVY